MAEWLIMIFFCRAPRKYYDIVAFVGSYVIVKNLYKQRNIKAMLSIMHKILIA